MTVDKSDLIAELEQKLAKAKQEQKEFESLELPYRLAIILQEKLGSPDDAWGYERGWGEPEHKRWLTKAKNIIVIIHRLDPKASEERVLFFAKQLLAEYSRY